MTEEEFIKFIELLGFTKTWNSASNEYYLTTDKLSTTLHNQSSFRIISVLIQNSLRFQLSTIDSLHNFRGLEYGVYRLKTFCTEGDSQIYTFFEFIQNNFIVLPDRIRQIIRDRRIDDIFKF